MLKKADPGNATRRQLGPCFRMVKFGALVERGFRVRWNTMNTTTERALSTREQDFESGKRTLHGWQDRFTITESYAQVTADLRARRHPA
jgi:hypothetical protein